MARTRLFLSALLACALLAACRKEPGPWDAAEEQPWASGGSQTVFDAGGGAFGHPFPELSGDKLAVHEVGDAAFEATFVSAPAPINPGLGPVFNSVSCASCHIGDGRGKPPAPGDPLISMLFRISVPGAADHGAPAPVPGFGGQLQQRAIFGAQPEAQVDITYTTSMHAFGNGDMYELRTPSYAIVAPYTALPPDLLYSPRVAPPVFGLGLLEAIPETDIRAKVDPSDANGDNISGRANDVWDATHARTALGRFGWKAGQPSLLQQTAGAYNEDMGVTNQVFNTESAWGQPQYDGLADESEVSDSLLQAVTFYVRTLAVPARRNIDDPQVVQGAQLFNAAGCDRCHTPQQHTRVDMSFPEISNQTIFPYTDLLLHDMGEGLADHRPDFQADGNEWRTPPLWGIGLTPVVNGHQNYLHDGRARSLLEAVLWHGGEAEGAKEFVRALSATERAALIAFLNSL